MRELSEAEKAREETHRGLQQRREQKEWAKLDKERNAAIAKAAEEKLEEAWKPYIVAMKVGNYTKKTIPTFRQVQRYLTKEKNITRAQKQEINATNALEKMKQYYS